MKEVCETCRFWREPIDDSHLGHCRRFPPSFNPHAVQLLPSRRETFFGGWPPVNGDEWCGEWQEASSEGVRCGPATPALCPKCYGEGIDAATGDEPCKVCTATGVVWCG